MKKELLGQTLLEKGYINPTQLQSAQADQKRFGGLIGPHLVRGRALLPQQWLSFFSEMTGIPIADFTDCHISLEALQAVPKNVCQKYTLVPMAKIDIGPKKQLQVAMSDPLDMNAIREVEFCSNCTAIPVLAWDEDIEYAIGHCYTDEGLKEAVDGLSGQKQIELNKLTAQNEKTVIFTQDGEEVSIDPEHRAPDLTLRVLIDYLANRGVIDLAEFRDRLKKTRDENN